MATIGDYFEKRPTDSNNNFMLLRLFAASLVIYGHARAMSAPCSDCRDILARIGYRYSGDLALHIFFVISGFLILASFDKRQDLRSFVVSRLLRIYPALWVCLILSVIAGAILTSFSIGSYITDKATYQYLTLNGILYDARFTLPGVVFTPNPKYGSTVNGSIWSLFVEIRLYLIVAIAGAFGIVSSRLASNAVLVAIVLIGMLSPSYVPLIDELPDHRRISAFFAAGAFLYINRNAVPMKWEIFGLLILASVISKHSQSFDIVAGATVAYGTLYLGLSTKIPLPVWLQDYSYGIYLYGWPTGQIVAHYLPDLGPKTLTAIVVPASWALGFVSWHLVEKRALKLKSKLGRKREVTAPSCPGGRRDYSGANTVAGSAPIA